ncbi:MAG: hypothetical protein S0880_08375 [Actinomycetota bacterium]|nr:hypothetical protein [Actinomycetota bacterium]
MSGRRLAALGAVGCLACCAGPLLAAVGVGVGAALDRAGGPVIAVLGVLIVVGARAAARRRSGRGDGDPAPDTTEPTRH